MMQRVFPPFVVLTWTWGQPDDGEMRELGERINPDVLR